MDRPATEYLIPQLDQTAAGFQMTTITLIHAPIGSPRTLKLLALAPCGMTTAEVAYNKLAEGLSG